MQRIAILFLIAATILVVPNQLFAAPRSQPDIKIGVLDYQKAWSEYDLTKKYREQYADMVNKSQAQLDRRDRNRLLTEEQLKELDALYEKAAPTDQDKVRIKALEDEASKLDAELKSLQSKKPPTDEEKKRLEELQNRSKQTDTTIQSLNEKLSTQLEETDAKWTKQVNEDISAAVKKVAEQKGFHIVFNKGLAAGGRSDTQVVLYGGTDITDLVLEALNKKK